MTAPSIAAVVLAAGKGTRMKSDLPKVLHPLAGRPMVHHVLDAVAALKPARQVVVVGPDMDALVEAVAPLSTAIQERQLGTADAVKAARAALADFSGTVLVLYGDTPLLSPATLEALVEARSFRPEPSVVVLGFRPADPAAYGRLIVGTDGRLEAIVEAGDATPAERAVGLCNSGVMAIDGRHLFVLLDAIGSDNAKREFYLTDIVKLARARGLVCRHVEADAAELMGVNSRAELAQAEAVLQARLRRAAMDAGATLLDPATTWFSHDTRLGRDVTVGPSVVFGPGVSVGDRVEIRAFCHLEGAVVEDDAIVGPFARLRPGARIGRGAHVGNFVEIKNAALEAGAKANHLSYIGDARVGAAANVGAGTITCNYDGFVKAHTDIGRGAFIGSNTALVAPVKIGDNAIVGAGSVIVDDVPADALAVARGAQKTVKGGATRFRAGRRAKPKAPAVKAAAAKAKAGAKTKKPKPGRKPKRRR
ncbi:MAG TPA: bifunctional UDP-N-acetylglucosamine diphosphorylase/glucosamine-1-phosphate N-acetyltransferase GlmU [Alphaproteobacteria bacterium]|jgi:bifunctional UDP-N-acetylglucosamine pyrophosphorylase/glucosamine-1-phosphate N-acetyltransferase|nr:bifunctional UDP-N-acetylglucosamine diphosphorylase/glucosamine-1-phosphate N-acetyltransferase GlmU [Alphaproteobacteria bacterium]